MSKCGVLACLVVVLAASSYLTGVDTSPLPPRLPRIDVGSEPSERVRSATETDTNSLTKNKIRTKRGIPSPCVDFDVDDTDCEWEKVKPCGCDPCDSLRNANEARMIRKQHRKIVAEMKMNRLKRKLHTAVCPSCALAHEREREREREMEHKPCTKPHVDITVVVPGTNSHEAPREYPMLPPSRPTYTQVMETGSKAIQMAQFNEAPYEEPMVPMVPEPQYERPLSRPGFGFGPAVPWSRSSAPDEDTAEKRIPEEMLESGPQRIGSGEERKFEGLIFPENTTESPVVDSEDARPVSSPRNKKEDEESHDRLSLKTTTETPKDVEDAEDAWPFRNGTYYQAATNPPVMDSEDARPVYRNETEGNKSLDRLSPKTTTEAPKDAEDAEDAWPFRNATYYQAATNPPVRDSEDARPIYRNETEGKKSLDRLSPKTTTEAPKDAEDAEDAWPFRNATYYQAATNPPIMDSEDARPIYRNETEGKKSLDRLSPNTTTEAPKDAEDAWPFRNATYDKNSPVAPPPDILWRTAYLAASKAVASAINNSVSFDSLKPDGLPVRSKNCSNQCTEAEWCSGAKCFQGRQKRDTSFGMSLASALLTGLVSIIGV